MDSDVEQLTLVLPESAAIPAGSTFYEGEDDGACRVIRPDGRRCRANRIKAYGLCIAHAGKTLLAQDPVEAQRRSRESFSRRRERRLLLGITRRGVGDPRLLVRERLAERADAAARAAVDGVLDDPKLSGLERQTGVLRAIEAAFPSVQAQLQIDLPADPGEAAALEWEQLKALAAAHLEADSGLTGLPQSSMDTGIEPALG